MRAMSSEFESTGPADSFLGVLDQFAALRSYSDEPAVGGYRVLSAKRASKRFAAPRLAPTAAKALAAAASARLRLTGSLSILFIGGLGLAVLAGPANCPCSVEMDVAQRSSLTRLGYVDNARFVSEVTSQQELPTLATAALVEPGESAAGVSPITTSALEPAPEIAAVKRDGFGAVSAGTLPTRIEPLSDAGPTVRVAAAGSAAGVESDVAPVLPVITATTPPAKVAVTDDDDDEEVPRAKRRKNLRAYRTPVGKSERHAQRPSDEQLVKRAPKWAQQMYVTPWQMQAFSYTR